VPIPASHRPALRAVLDRLTAGEFPEHLTWVRRYGRDGATLVRQPEAIWDHPRSEVLERDDGSFAVTVPLWTTEQSPSDLSAELRVSSDGVVAVDDVRVM
jgi:hypothetical protein